MRRLLSTVLACGLAVATAVHAAGPAETSTLPGFYGGISLRTGAAPSQGLALGGTGSAWSHYALPAADDAGNRALAYGGYRFANDAALEVAVSTFDRYTLAPPAPGTRRGVGLALATAGEPAGKAWNVDLYTTWELRRSLALYGRLGYTQSNAATMPLAGFTGDVRRERDGMNYGVGVRYDLNSALGLRLEYSRFARLPGEFAPGALPESDQVQFGVQYRF